MILQIVSLLTNQSINLNIDRIINMVGNHNESIKGSYYQFIK